MAERTRLADFTHPAIQKTASKLTEGIEDTRRKIEKIFESVRDDIPFGFTPTWNELKASDVMACGVGYCNTKATLFLALCRASAVTARVHFGLIDIRIMYGILPSSMPKTGSHSWIEVRLGDGFNAVQTAGYPVPAALSNRNVAAIRSGR